MLWARFLDHPVEDEVILVAHAIEEILEELPKVANIGLLLELEAAAVVQIDAKLVGQVLCQSLDRRRQFLVTDFLILFLLCASWEALPGQTAFIEVHEDEAERLKIVSSALLDA